MFEDQQETVQGLLNNHPEFKELYTRHQDLKERVSAANVGAEPLDDFALDRMKKEKLLLKDKMAVILTTVSKG